MFASPPPGFEGIDEQKALCVYSRNLPHWRQEGATYFVTFRMADSLPAPKLAQLKQLKSDWEQENPPPHDSRQLRALKQWLGEKIETWLDQGHGSCALGQVAIRRMVANALDHFKNERYLLFSRVIMPNHVHVLVKPLAGNSLEQILHSWKWFTAKEGNIILGKSGIFWQRESHDHIVRDEEDLYRVLQYIGQNPAKVGLTAGDTELWVEPDWEETGWGFDD